MIRVLVLLWAAAALPAAELTADSPDRQPVPLTTDPGRIDAGRSVFVDRDRGHCLLCHQVRQLEAPFQGNLGPDLSGVGARLSAAQLRFRLVDMSRLNPATVMPPYYRTKDLRQVATARQGQPVLSAQDIEDLIAYLQTLDSANDPA